MHQNDNISQNYLHIFHYREILQKDYDVCPHNWQMLTHNKESVYIDFFLFKANKRKLDEAHNTAEMTLKNHISANENQQLKRC